MNWTTFEQEAYAIFQVSKILTATFSMRMSLMCSLTIEIFFSCLPLLLSSLPQHGMSFKMFSALPCFFQDFPTLLSTLKEKGMCLQKFSHVVQEHTERAGLLHTTFAVWLCKQTNFAGSFEH